jgi:hypothetical protein
MHTEVEFVVKKIPRKAVMFTGLPGIGLVGKIAVDYMLRQFKTKLVANVYSDSFPPSVHTSKGLLEPIKDEIRLFTFKKKPYLFLCGPVQPTLDMRFGLPAEHYEFAEVIVQSAKKMGVREIYTLAGINIGEERMEREPGIVVAATDEATLREFKSLGAKVNPVPGLISGAAGLILGYAKRYNIKGACLMGETSTRLIYGDHGAAKKLLELLIKRHGFELDMSGIKREARNIEEAFKQLGKQLQMMEQEDAQQGELSYVR